MRFLVDANLSPGVAARLTSAGFESVHVADVGLLTAADQAILNYAAENELE
jgi:predicted nuclease of predicted toxin-antitoxin system